MPNYLDLALAQIQQALDTNDRLVARRMLVQYLQTNPGNADAWWLMSRIVESPAHQQDCLVRLLAIDPSHHQAQQQLALLDQQQQAAASVPPALAAQPGGDQTAPVPLPIPLLAPGVSEPAAEPGIALPSATYAQWASAAHQGLPPGSYVPGQPQILLAAPGPAKKPRKRPLWIDISLALLVLVFAAYLISRGLSESNQSFQPSRAPAVPKISAQDRATGFLNALYGTMKDPGLYDPDQVETVLKLVADEYLVATFSRKDFATAVRIGLTSEETDQENIDFFIENVDSDTIGQTLS